LPGESDNGNKQEVSINRRLPDWSAVVAIVLQLPDKLFGDQQTSFAGGEAVTESALVRRAGFGASHRVAVIA
jgi:hypothetical protein